MKYCLFFLLVAAPVLARAQAPLDPAPSAVPDRVPGLVSAELLPGWVTPDGHRMTALSLHLEPGWKTYWRSPGDTGVPPQFDWGGSLNLGQVIMHWPRPEAIESGGERTLGYHDRLVLPIEVTPAASGQPVELNAVIDFGLCHDICVPVQVALTAPAPQAGPDSQIAAALAQVPALSSERPDCRIDEIKDGMRVTAEFDQLDAPEVAMELDDDSVWVSQPELARRGGRLIAQSDFVDKTGKPFALDADGLRLTLIAPDAATEFRGCDPAMN